MNISYKPVGTILDYVTIVDDTTTANGIEEFRPRSRCKPQTQELCAPPGSTGGQFRQPLGNLSTDLPVKNWYVGYTTMDAALAAAAAVPAALLGTKFHLKITQGTTVLFIPNAVATEFEANVQGSNVTYNGTMSGDLLTATDPG